MKRTLLDITNTISRDTKKVYLKPYNLDDNTYYIWIAEGWRFASIKREIEYRQIQNRLKVRINTHEINPVDFITEQISNGLLVKFYKNNFEYVLDTADEILLTGDLENYA